MVRNKKNIYRNVLDNTKTEYGEPAKSFTFSSCSSYGSDLWLI